MNKEECEYCHKIINNKKIICIDAPYLEIYKDNYFGYQIIATIDNTDDLNCYPKAPKQFFIINNCPICGRKLDKE